MYPGSVLPLKANQAPLKPDICFPGTLTWTCSSQKEPGATTTARTTSSASRRSVVLQGKFSILLLFSQITTYFFRRFLVIYCNVVTSTFKYYFIVHARGVRSNVTAPNVEKYNEEAARLPDAITAMRKLVNYVKPGF